MLSKIFLNVHLKNHARRKLHIDAEINDILFTFIADYIIKRELQKKEIMTSKVISLYFGFGGALLHVGRYLRLHSLFQWNLSVQKTPYLSLCGGKRRDVVTKCDLDGNDVCLIVFVLYNQRELCNGNAALSISEYFVTLSIVWSFLDVYSLKIQRK